MLGRFKQNMTKLYAYLMRHRHILVGVFLLLGVGLLVYGFPALAQGPQSQPDNIIISIITRMLLALARFFMSITLFILSYVIEVSGYNGYLDARAVNMGWIIVRDFTNMIFVVALLIIAFSTILGVEHYEWKKQLFKLVGAAIIVNFSRTICGIFIDIAQVVMNTFVNGIAATAGGNLIQAFHMENIGKISASDPAMFNDTNYFIAAFGSVFFAACVMALMGAILYMLVARMVVLWVLIVLSPLAFVLSAVPQTEEYSSRWWSEFGANIVTGPVLLFFIWLSFATIGAGDLDQHIRDRTITKQANTQEAEQFSNPCSAIVLTLCWNNMANFVISFAMLMVGVKIAGELGGAGAGMAEQAMQFGQKAALTLSGASTVAYLATEGAKLGVRKFPFIGTDAWERYGMYAKGIAGYKWWQFQQGRNNLAKKAGDTDKKFRDEKRKYDLELRSGKLTKEQYDKNMKELKAKTSGWARLGGRIGETFLETGDRKKKKAEDWVDAAEEKYEAYSGDFSTSSYAGGQRKYDAIIENQLVSERGHAKKKIKLSIIEGAAYGAGKPFMDEAKAAYKEYHSAEHEFQHATEHGDQQAARDAQAKMAEAKKKMEDVKKRIEADGGRSLYTTTKDMWANLASTTTSSKALEHQRETEKELAIKRFEEVYGHTSDGHKVHEAAGQAEMRKETAELGINTETQHIKLGLLAKDIGRAMLEAQAGFDAQGGAVTTARQQILSDIRDTRADEADVRVRADGEKAKQAVINSPEVQQMMAVDGVTDIDDLSAAKKLEVKSRIANAVTKVMKRLSGDQAEVASAYYKALQDESKALEDRTRSLLEEEVQQSIIGERQQIPFPNRAVIEAVERLGSQFKGMEKEDLIQSLTSRLNAIKEKRAKQEREAGVPGGYVYDRKEERTDQMYTQALYAQGQKLRYFDDLTGEEEGVEKAVSDKLKGLRASLKQAEEGAGVREKEVIEVGRRIGERARFESSSSSEDRRSVKSFVEKPSEDLRNFTATLKNLVGREVGKTKDFKSLLAYIQSNGLDAVRAQMPYVQGPGGSLDSKAQEQMLTYLRVIANEMSNAVAAKDRSIQDYVDSI